MSTQNQELFLHAPPQDWLDQLSNELRQRIRAAETALSYGRERMWHPMELGMLNAMEARASANIEGEHDPARIQEHSLALGEFLQRPAGGKSLLKMHRWMMRGQPHAQPGRYRSVYVRVGQHRPPSPGLVPHLMDELWEWLSEQPSGPTSSSRPSTPSRTGTAARGAPSCSRRWGHPPR